jgi:aspartate/methionine/tyrosine aminotransferase
MSISKKIKASISQSSMIRKMFEQGILLKKKHGEDNVYDFSLGNPNVDHPEEFKKELIAVADEEIALKHGYAQRGLSGNKAVCRPKNKQNDRSENNSRSCGHVLRSGRRA